MNPYLLHNNLAAVKLIFVFKIQVGID